jgi:hypothetical protein
MTINIHEYSLDGKRDSAAVEVFKHGSHNQKTHAGSKGGGAGVAGGGEAKEMPYRPSPSDALSQKIMSDIPRGEANAAYSKGFEEGKTASPKLVDSAKSWHDMTASAVEAGKDVSQQFLLESVRAIGIINGNLQG